MRLARAMRSGPNSQRSGLMAPTALTCAPRMIIGAGNDRSAGARDQGHDRRARDRRFGRGHRLDAKIELLGGARGESGAMLGIGAEDPDALQAPHRRHRGELGERLMAAADEAHLVGLGQRQPARRHAADAAGAELAQREGFDDRLERAVVLSNSRRSGLAPPAWAQLLVAAKPASGKTAPIACKVWPPPQSACVLTMLMAAPAASRSRPASSAAIASPMSMRLATSASVIHSGSDRAQLPA